MSSEASHAVKSSSAVSHAAYLSFAAVLCNCLQQLCWAFVFRSKCSAHVSTRVLCNCLPQNALHMSSSCALGFRSELCTALVFRSHAMSLSCKAMQCTYLPQVCTSLVRRSHAVHSSSNPTRLANGRMDPTGFHGQSQSGKSRMEGESSNMRYECKGSIRNYCLSNRALCPATAQTLRISGNPEFSKCDTSLYPSQPSAHPSVHPSAQLSVRLSLSLSLSANPLSSSWAGQTNMSPTCHFFSAQPDGVQLSQIQNEQCCPA